MKKRKKRLVFLCFFFTFIGFLLFNECTRLKIGDITGEWKISIFGSDGNTITMNFVFVGDNREGVIYRYYNDCDGTYIMSGDEVNFNFGCNSDIVFEYTFKGYFVDKYKMRGTVTYTEDILSDSHSEFHWDWVAERQVLYLDPDNFPSLDNPLDPPL